MSPAGRVRRPDAIADRIRERGEDIRREELAAALRKLEASEDLSPAQRAAVEAMTENVVDDLLGPTVRSIRDVDDPETLAAASDVFGPDD